MDGGEADDGDDDDTDASRGERAAAETAMEAEGRLIYEFEVVRAYGLLAT